MTHMERAISLAKGVLGTTSPNPAVGAVIVQGKTVFITDTSGTTVSRIVSQARVEFAASAAPTPIQTGVLNVTVSLQAGFSIGQSEN